MPHEFLEHTVEVSLNKVEGKFVLNITAYEQDADGPSDVADTLQVIFKKVPSFVEVNS